MSDKDELLEELQAKLQEIEVQLEDLPNHEFGAEILAQIEGQSVTLDSGNSSRGFRVHWVLPDETSFGECDEIDTVEKAQRAFAEFSMAKNQNKELFVYPGDVLIIPCNHAPIEEEKDDEGNVVEDGETFFEDACYYIGMCISNEALKERNLSLDFDSLITAFEGDPDDVGRQFIAWDTCSGLCDEDADDIEIDEIIFPEDDESESGGSSEEQRKGLTVTQQEEFRKLAVIHQLTTLKFEKQDPEESGGDGEEVKPYALFKDASEVTNKIDDDIIGVQFGFSNEFLHENQKFDYKGTSDKVSIMAADVRAELQPFNPLEIEIRTVSISSTSCGSLSKEIAKDEEKDPPEEKIRKKTLLVSDDDFSPSLEDQFELSALKTIEGSAQVSLGNVLELNIFEKTDEVVVAGSNTDNFFVPRLPDTSTIRDIKVLETVDIISDFKIDVTKVKVETEESENGEECFTITLKPAKKVRELKFHSGVLTKAEDESGLSWEALPEIEFKTKACPEECADNYTVSGPGVSSATLDCIDATATNIYPDCCSEYNVNQAIPYSGPIPENDLNPGMYQTNINITLTNNGHGMAVINAIIDETTPDPDPEVAFNFKRHEWEAEKDIEIGDGASLEGQFMITESTVTDNTVIEQNTLVGDPVTVTSS